MKQLFLKYRHIWILAYGLIYLIWFRYLERTVRSHYRVMHAAIDDYIPFCEYFIIPYFLWFAYVAVTIGYFFFTSREEYYRLCICLFAGMTISLIICTFFPNGTDFRPAIDPEKNVFSALVHWLYRIDTCTNVFPSVHVYNALCTHAAIRRSPRLRAHLWIRRGSFLLMVLICISTVCLKQHSVIDGVGAAILAYALYHVVYGYSEFRAEKKAAQKVPG